MTALDVSLHLREYQGHACTRLTIRSYPPELELVVTLNNGQYYLFQLIFPEDKPLLKVLICQVTCKNLYYRYFSKISEFTYKNLADMMKID